MKSRVSKLLLVTGLLFASTWIAKYAVAGFYFEQAKKAYDQLDLSALNYSHELDYIVDDINRSLDFRRSSADALDFKANLLYQSWWLSPDGQYLQDSKLLQRALILHSDALKYRENWAYSAARQALIYSHQAKLDANFNHFFLESHRLGLYETTIARSLMGIGLKNWGQLSTEQKSITMDFIRASIEQKSNSLKAIRALLNDYQKLVTVCQTLPNTIRKLKVCDGFK